jgi:hypothetical protein
VHSSAVRCLVFVLADSPRSATPMTNSWASETFIAGGPERNISPRISPEDEACLVRMTASEPT